MNKIRENQFSGRFETEIEIHFETNLVHFVMMHFP